MFFKFEIKGRYFIWFLYKKLRLINHLIKYFYTFSIMKFDFKCRELLVKSIFHKIGMNIDTNGRDYNMNCVTHYMLNCFNWFPKMNCLTRIKLQIKFLSTVIKTEKNICNLCQIVTGPLSQRQNCPHDASSSVGHFKVVQKYKIIFKVFIIFLGWEGRFFSSRGRFLFPFLFCEIINVGKQFWFSFSWWSWLLLFWVGKQSQTSLALALVSISWSLTKSYSRKCDVIQYKRTI